MGRKVVPRPEPRGEEVRVHVDLDELEARENGELREIVPDDPHLLFNRIIIINGPVMRRGPLGK